MIELNPTLLNFIRVKNLDAILDLWLSEDQNAYPVDIFYEMQRDFFREIETCLGYYGILLDSFRSFKPLSEDIERLKEIEAERE